MNHQIGPVLLVFSPPHKLGVQIPVPPFIGNTDRVQLIFAHDRLKFRGGDVFPGCVIVLDGFYSQRGLLFGHFFALWANRSILFV